MVLIRFLLALPRAAWRLLRVLLHVLWGLLILAFLFDRLDTAGRHARIGAWSAGLLRALGLRLQVHGQARAGAGLLVANHVSWLDIAALHSACPRARFVSKADVLQWPLLGWMIRQGGTLFIQRERKRDAMRVVHEMAAAIGQGDLVAVFPEGTTGPGHPVLPFHGNLLQAAIAVAAPIQPVALRYHQPGQAFAEAARYIGDTTLLGSLACILMASGLTVEVDFLSPQASAHADRRSLAEALRGQLEAALETRAQAG
ncbi:lysophospholipid acyltransferase family protein [Ideonella livida]|uniref:1-acyl-sn-glycerol-3-phosphate acyltransferase n=1 Tax=Ideonella livida TaxID=2707176 RepID=A0A7C9PKF0_9BURK|nr:lysophospholipid acyltransferase family protein [Ideonella livida]NDY93252.1 1-acyl-sn-glycerol-3-phosphate acyltransferase [Ideonella livida]